MFRIGFAVCSIVLLACCCGCAEEEFGTVTGTVTMDGAPAEEVTVIYRPEDGRRESIAVTDAAGRYELHYSLQRMGAWIGRHTVTLSTLNVAPGGNGVRVASAQTIPAQYNLRTTLTADVTAGENVIDFAITSEGEIELPAFLKDPVVEFEDDLQSKTEAQSGTPEYVDPLGEIPEEDRRDR